MAAEEKGELVSALGKGPGRSRRKRIPCSPCSSFFCFLAPSVGTWTSCFLTTRRSRASLEFAFSSILTSTEWAVARRKTSTGLVCKERQSFPPCPQAFNPRPAAHLPDPVAAVHRLEVHVRVPVRVIQDDRVRRGQVDAQASGPGREKEDLCQVAYARGFAKRSKDGEGDTEDTPLFPLLRAEGEAPLARPFLLAWTFGSELNSWM